MPRQLKSGEYLGRLTGAGKWDSCSVSETHYGRGAFLAAHRHDGSFLTFVLAGGYREHAGGETRTCTPGSLVIHAPGETHEDDFAEKPARCLNIILAPSFTSRLGAVSSTLEGSRVVEGESLSIIGHQIRSELLHRDPAAELIVEGLLLELAGTLSRGSDSTRNGAAGWLQRAAAIIENQFHQKISLSSIARDVGVHPVHLARQFRLQFGVSIGERVRTRRIDQARRLIAAGMPLPVVAMDVGFADQSHFTRMFTRLVGMSPGAWRRGSAPVSHVPKRSKR